MFFGTLYKRFAITTSVSLIEECLNNIRTDKRLVRTSQKYKWTIMNFIRLQKYQEYTQVLPRNQSNFFGRNLVSFTYKSVAQIRLQHISLCRWARYSGFLQTYGILKLFSFSFKLDSTYIWIRFMRSLSKLVNNYSRPQLYRFSGSPRPFLYATANDTHNFHRQLNVKLMRINVNKTGNLNIT